jgi:hypothetical protein
MAGFSVVVPIRNEVSLIPKTLPSYIALCPDELIICLDRPAPEDVLTSVKKVLDGCHFNNKTKILEIDSFGWRFKMAKVRRVGFLATSYDRIFTGDIDCVVNENCHKAIGAIGENNIAMASVTKFHLPKKLIDIYRLIGYGIIKVYIHRIAKKFGASSFSGQYALYKPYWLDVPEELEDAKKMFSVKQKMRQGKIEMTDMGLSSMGEDIHMREFIAKKHKVVYLSDIGAYVLSDPYENNPVVQFWKGTYFASRGRSLIISIARAFLRCQPYYLMGCLYERRRMRCQNN